MKKVIIALTLIFVSSTFSNAQSNLNDYKYVIVPNRFEFLKSNDQYQLNSLSKFLFNKNGFTAVMEDETFVQDLVNNRCLALDAVIEKKNSFLKTKLVVILKNCKNETIFTSVVGESKEKEYKKAYNFALRNAFKSFETIDYSYVPNENIVAQSSKTEPINNQEIEKLKEEIKTLKEEKAKKVVLKEAAEVEKIPEKKVVVAIPEIKKDVKETIEKKPIITTKKASDILYAQEIENGFQIVDSTPKVVMILLTTPKKDTFIVKGKDAIVYIEDGFWYLSESNANKTTTKTINIKF